MITKPPKNKYEKQIYIICSNIEKLPEGEKSIIYDLATQWIPEQCMVDFKDLDLDNYIHNIRIIYDKHKSTPIVNLVNMFIKKFDMEKIENNKKYLGGNYGTSENITSQQRYWFGEFS